MGICSLCVQKEGDYVKSTSGLDIKKKAELVRKINKSKSLNELFTLIRRENIEFQMFNQPVLTGITQIISDLKPVESENDVPFERVKKKAREAILASSDEFIKNGTVGEYEGKVIKEINKCKSLSEIFSVIGRENIDLESFSQYKATSVTPGVLEIKQIKNKRELPFERIKEMAMNSVLAVDVKEIDSEASVASEKSNKEIEEVIDAAVEEVMSEFENGQMPEELFEVLYNEKIVQNKVELVDNNPKIVKKTVEFNNIENLQAQPEYETVSINNDAFVDVNNSYTNNMENENGNYNQVEIPLEEAREKVRQVFETQILNKNHQSEVNLQGAAVLNEIIEVIENCNSLDEIYQTLEQEKI